MSSFHNYAIILIVSSFLVWFSKGMLVSRQDGNYDLMIYLNGKSIQSYSTLNMPAFQQITGLVQPNGQRVPPTIQMVNGQMQVVPTPAGMYNLVITMRRTVYGPFNGGNNNFQN